MAVPLLPILGTLSSLATTAWDTYSKVKHARESALATRAERESREALISRLEKLEELCLEQAHLVSDLSKDLDQFAQALRSQLEAAQQRQTHLSRLLYATAAAAIVSLAVSSYLLLK